MESVGRGHLSCSCCFHCVVSLTLRVAKRETRNAERRGAATSWRRGRKRERKREGRARVVERKKPAASPTDDRVCNMCLSPADPSFLFLPSSSVPLCSSPSLSATPVIMLFALGALSGQEHAARRTRTDADTMDPSRGLIASFVRRENPPRSSSSRFSSLLLGSARTPRVNGRRST